VLIGVLVDPTYPAAEAQRRELHEAADTLKQPIAVVTAVNARADTGHQSSRSQSVYVNN
jgi:hypothetical protein